MNVSIYTQRGAVKNIIVNIYTQRGVVITCEHLYSKRRCDNMNVSICTQLKEAM